MGRMLTTVAAVVALCTSAAAQDFQHATSGTITQPFMGTFSGCSAGDYYDQNNVLQSWTSG